MKTVVSKISGSYIGLVIFLHIAAITVMTISATYLRDIFYIEKRIFAGLVIIAMMIFLFIVWKEIMSANKIIVDENGIKIYNTNSIEKISFSEIDWIRKEKIKTMVMKDVPFTDGYTYSEIILKSGKSLIISPDKYDNYLEIMAFINSQIDNQQFT